MEHVSKFPENFQLQGVRSIVAENKDEAMADCKTQDVTLNDTATAPEYVCSVLSSVLRLPPFSFIPCNNISYLHIKSEVESDDAIMHLTDRNVWIIPLEDKRIQIIIVPQSSLRGQQGKSKSEQIKAIMTDIDEDKIKKHASLYLPSFKLNMESTEVAGAAKAPRSGLSRVLDSV